MADKELYEAIEDRLNGKETKLDELKLPHLHSGGNNGSFVGREVPSITIK
jgi:hypothetical protein